MKTFQSWVKRVAGALLLAGAMASLEAATWVAGSPQAPMPQDAQPPWEVSENPGASFLNAARRLVILEPNVGFSRRGPAADVSDRFQMAVTMRVVQGVSGQPNAAVARFGFRMADGLQQSVFIHPGGLWLEGIPGGAEGPSAPVDTSAIQTYTLTVERRDGVLEAVVRVSGGAVLRAPLVNLGGGNSQALFFGSVAGGASEWLAVSDNAGGAPFSYQGRLNHPAGRPANGNFDFRFQLWDAPTGGRQVGNTVRLPNTPVSAGLFGVDLNFGAALVGSGDPLVLDPWLSIEVSPTGSSQPFTLLTPRVPLRPVPSALRAWRAASLDQGVAVTSLNGLTDGVQLATGPGLTLQRDAANRILTLNLSGGGGGPLPAHDHFGQAWQGANPLAGLLLANTDANGTALRLESASDLIRGFPTGAQVGEPPSFRVTRLGDVTARGFAGNGSQLTGLSWDQLPGPLPVDRLPMIPRDRLPADLGGPLPPHHHFGETWLGNSPGSGLFVNNTHPNGAALGLRGHGEVLQVFGPAAGTPAVFEVGSSGSVRAASFAGNGSQLTGLSWDQLPGTIPVDRLPMIPRDRLPADLGSSGGGGTHNHFAEFWKGTNAAPGLWVENAHGEGVGLLGQASGVAGTGVRGFGQRAGLEGSGPRSGVLANSPAGSSLLALTETGINLELGNSSGDFIQGRNSTGLTFQVTAAGDIFARRLNLSGTGSGIVGLTWESLPGTVPVDKLPMIPRDKLPADLAGGADHSHFGQTWTANDPAKPVGLRVVNQTAAGFGVLGIGSEAGVEGRYSDPGLPGEWPSIGQLGSRTAGVSGIHRDSMGVAGFSGSGTGIWAASESGIPLSVEARGGFSLILGRRLNPDATMATVFEVMADGAVTGRSFAGDGSGLTGLNWNQLSGEVPEFNIPASIARTNHNHAGETWSSTRTTLTLLAQGPAGTSALRALGGEGVAISAESSMTSAITGITWSNDRAGVQGEAMMGGAGILGTANSGTGVVGYSRLGIGVAAASTGGAALSATTTTGAVIRGFRNTETSSDEVFTVTGTGDVTAAGSFSATAFNTTSDRHAKTGFTAVDPQEVLRKVAALPITRWAFTNAAAVAHIGPVAQDFHAAFGVGPDDRHIATVDADGVALAAIQGLNAKLESELRTKDAELRALKAEMSELRQMLRGAPPTQP